MKLPSNLAHATWFLTLGLAACTQPQVAETAVPYQAEPLEIVVDGSSDWLIVIPDEPTVQEKQAAQLFAQLFQQATAVELPVVRENSTFGGRRILFGQSQFGNALCKELGIDSSTLGEDGFTIQAGHGNIAFQSGPADGTPTTPMGLQYAVCHFMESQLGARFWAPGVLEIPHHDHVGIAGDFSLTQIPPVWFRQVNYGPANDLAYLRWHKLDRVQKEIGKLWAPRWVHSAFHHLGPKEYFEQHPEYFALVGNTRTPSQLCMSHPQVLEIVAASFERELAANPGVRYISFSQEDNYDACACRDCAEIDEREGTQMGSLLTFFNALADRFPSQVISTLAYQYSRQPPRTIRPRANVSIMLCTIEEDRARPIPANPNSSFPAHFAGWRELTDDIFLWDYEVQFASPVAPFPNLRTLSPNVRWFADTGVRHLFLQGNGLRTEFAELRCYLLAKLAWDPTVDTEALMDEFLVGFYGPAAEHLRAYIDLLHDEVEKSGEELVLYGNPALAKDSWLRPAVMTQARAYFDAAEAAVVDHADFALRVRTARLPLMYAELEIAKRRGANPGGIWNLVDVGGLFGAAAGQQKLLPRTRISEVLEAFLNGCEDVGIRKLREYDLTLSTYQKDWQRLLDPELPNHLAFDAEVQVTPPANPQYADGNAAHLVDGLPGGRPGSAPVTRAYGENWVGWMGTDATITVTPNKNLDSAKCLSFQALQEPKSWIWLPDSIRVEVCTLDGQWREIATLQHTVGDRENLAHPFEVALPTDHSWTAIRLHVEATKTCPDWHLGAGLESWFFFDELRID